MCGVLTCARGVPTFACACVRNLFQAFYVSAMKAVIYYVLKNNYLIFPGLALRCYLIITVLPGDFLIRVLTLGRRMHH